jgi:hypothetical protein
MRITLRYDKGNGGKYSKWQTKENARNNKGNNKGKYEK